ncbi:gem-associated protein 2 [Coccinella septempunctata]|uniref:gem-associated protein 2 n=1 Tax=Coccinella septempunctata TaxID=41139 RepID=UPI001D062536|nr:gem-associated protein 2 [Coccinella septempunctata]XP_044756228.1 gem-associated protein 2 [Coccinella septempunctata]XP_044756230.1 gem-associated protein 2 [Coccinella septempunctata]
MSDEEYNSDCSIASDYGLLKKALPFDTRIPANFDPNKVPQTAEEFLQYACYERSLMKPWTTAKIDPAKLHSIEVREFKEDVLNNTVAPHLLPTQQWQKDKLDEFIEFREYIQSKMEITSKDVLREIDFKERIVKTSPEYEEVMKFSQADKIRALELINDYLDTMDYGTCFGDHVGSWIYSMLSLLDTPLISDDCHVVRTLAKKCIEIRSNYKETDIKKFFPLNLFICIISKFFGQLDLSDP